MSESIECLVRYNIILIFGGRIWMLGWILSSDFVRSGEGGVEFSGVSWWLEYSVLILECLFDLERVGCFFLRIGWLVVFGVAYFFLERYGGRILKY